MQLINACDKWLLKISMYKNHIIKISPVQAWQLTPHNWRFCQLQSHVTQKLGQKSKAGPDKL